MTTLVGLHDSLINSLRNISSINVYEGEVPDSPPATKDGRVYPYAVVWTSPGTRPTEARSLDAGLGDELRWVVAVTIASGSQRWTLDAVQLVRRELEGRTLAPFSSPLEEDPSITQLNVLIDRDTTPARHYVPLTFITTTG